MTTLIPVQPDEIDLWWPELESWISEAADVTKVRGSEQWKDLCGRAKAQLWIISKDGAPAGAVITEVYETARGDTVGIPIAAGDLEDAGVVLGAIEWWARDIGAKRLEGCGRDGWIRALRSMGWKKLAVTVEKDL